MTKEERQYQRLSKWSRPQLEGDIIRLWKVEKKCLSEIHQLHKLLQKHHICSDCGAVGTICGCPFG